MNKPTFDKDGYPTEETLQWIESYNDWYDVTPLIEFILESWHWEDWAIWNPPNLELRTGGWSGNESIIQALHNNFIFMGFYWQKSERGGHHYYKIPIKGVS